MILYSRSINIEIYSDESVFRSQALSITFTFLKFETSYYLKTLSLTYVFMRYLLCCVYH